MNNYKQTVIIAKSNVSFFVSIYYCLKIPFWLTNCDPQNVGNCILESPIINISRWKMPPEPPQKFLTTPLNRNTCGTKGASPPDKPLHLVLPNAMENLTHTAGEAGDGCEGRVESIIIQLVREFQKPLAVATMSRSACTCDVFLQFHFNIKLCVHFFSFL